MALRLNSGTLARPAASRGRAAVAFAAKLTFEDVERHYDETRVLDGVSLEVTPGEIVGLLGPSGCGKTTLLRLAAGIERPTGGRILINDREVSGPRHFDPPERRGIGLMFQDFALFPHLTILGNVAFGLKSLPREDARREALAMLSRVGLERYAEDFPHILSGGEQQRIALARAIAPRPSVMLMDEPFSGLDVHMRDRMQAETLALLRETRATSVIVTHSPDEAMRLGDRIAVMRGGRLVQVGKADDLYHHPRDLFVARLFSEINEIAYRVSGGEIDTPVGRFAAPGAGDGETAVLCVRERGMTLAGPRRGGLPGRVLHVKFLGDVGVIEVGVEGFEQPLKLRAHESERWRKDDEVSVEIDRARVLVFPPNGPQTG